MATDVQHKGGVPKYEAFVETQLARVRKKIRALDVGRTAMLLGVVTLAYLLIMAGLDLAVAGAEDSLWTGVRLGLFGVYVLAMLFFFVQLGVRLYRRVNPYYAARQLEETLDDPKNSVINWLDLKEEELPGAIRNAVGLRAARELKQADPEHAVETRGNWLLGGALMVLVLAILVLFALGPNQFGSLLTRAFAPFKEIALASRTEITLLQPAGGDIAVPLQQRVEFSARIEGRFPKVNKPGSPKLLFRYQKNDVHVAMPLEEAPDGTWTATMQPDQVQSGFWYKLTAGDTETREYQVTVQAPPQATRFEASYKFRPYLNLPVITEKFPNAEAVMPHLKGHRGTEVTLLIHANRTLRDARIEIEAGGAKQDLPCELAADVRSCKATWVLEKSGTFRVFFTSTEGEANSDRGNVYTLSVLDDGTPNVVLTEPAKDVKLAANGHLNVEGVASDDLGLTKVTLRLQVLEGSAKPPLAPLAFRAGKSFRFETGGYPDKLDYKELLLLDKLKTAEGKPFTSSPGTVLEYWLEATDNSDYPNKDGNVGKSKAFKIAIIDPAKDQKKQDDERKAAQDKQKKFEERQDQGHAQENAERSEKAKADASKNEPQEDKKQQENLEQKLDKTAEKLAKELKEQEERGKAKGAEPKKGEQKPGNDQQENPAKTKDQKPADQEAGAKKDEGAKDKKDGAGQAKDQGPKDAGAEPKPSEAKGGGQQQPGANAKDAKNAPANAQNADKGNAKEGPGKEGQEQTAQAKDEGPKGDNTKPCACKGGGKEGAGQGQNIAEAKGEPSDAAKADAKGGEGAGMGQGGQQAGAKGGNPPGAGQANAKDAAGAGQNAAQAKDEGKRPEQREATAQDLERIKEKLKRPDQADEALNELTRLAKEAKDPSVKKQAEQMVREMAPGEPKAKGSNGPEVEAKGTPKGDGQPTDMGTPTAQTKSGEPGKGDQQAKGADGKSEPGQGQAKSGGKYGGSGPNGSGLTDEHKATAPHDAFAKKGGELQLDKLKDRITPEVLKKAGVSDADWQRFLKDAQAYNDLIRKNQAAAAKKGVNQQGTTSKLIGQDPSLVKSTQTGAVDPLQVDRALPPPEFRDAQKQFITRPK